MQRIEKRTKGIVRVVKKQWWFKVNTKPVRTNAMDGASFPHVVTVTYCVEGVEITKKKWLHACITPPSVGDRITVVYREDKPTKCRLEATDAFIQ